MTESDKYEIVNICLEMNALEAKFIDVGTITISNWVRHKCQYSCKDYGKTYCCPPHSPTPDDTKKIISDYTIGLLIHFGGDVRVTKAIVEIENRIFLNNLYKVIGFGAGPCSLCKKCSEAGCRFPEKARPSMEACGIDVYKTARENGFPIDVLKTKDDPENCYGLSLIE